MTSFVECASIFVLFACVVDECSPVSRLFSHPMVPLINSGSAVMDSDNFCFVLVSWWVSWEDYNKAGSADSSHHPPGFFYCIMDVVTTKVLGMENGKICWGRNFFFSVATGKLERFWGFLCSLATSLFVKLWNVHFIFRNLILRSPNENLSCFSLWTFKKWKLRFMFSVSNPEMKTKNNKCSKWFEN